MILKTGKEKCECGEMAQWIYIPGYTGGGSPYICDSCVSNPEDLGCSCNWHYFKDEEFPEGLENVDWRWVVCEENEYQRKITKKERIWVRLDEKGRPNPCAEYEYSKEGFDKLTYLGRKLEILSYKWFFFKEDVKRWWKKHICETLTPNDNRF